MDKPAVQHSVLLTAFRYSIPVLLGYIAIGAAFGLLMADAGYPWWLSLVMSAVMFAGAGQYIAVGFFAAGTGIWEAALVQLVVNARHMAYGLSMMNRFKNLGPLKFYIIFGLTDETFALLSSLPEESRSLPEENDSEDRARFMFLVTLLDHLYWIAGGLVGAVAGSLIPFSTEGIGFALTALFIVLMIEQMGRHRRPGIFIVAAALAVLCVLLLPSRLSLLAAMALSLAIGSCLPKVNLPKVNLPKRGGA